MPDTHGTAVAEPEIGSYFVANYPPFSVWTREGVRRDALPALDETAAGVPLGLSIGGVSSDPSPNAPKPMIAVE